MYGIRRFELADKKPGYTGTLKHENTVTISMPATAITALQRMVAGGGGAQ
jgi:hypothetical protein